MLTLFAETAVNSEPSSNSLKRKFQIPRRNGLYNESNRSQREHQRKSTVDEQSFRSQTLATASSSFFRHEKHYPRSFLWRVVANGTVLEILSTDLSRSNKTDAEADLTLCFEFQDRIIPLGVTLADSANSDLLHVFVCTDRNEIYNLRLPVDIFCSTRNVAVDVQELYKVVDISSLTIDTVYQLYANNPYELFAAFSGGKIQRIYRRADHETWNQDYYDDGSWTATFKGIVARRGLQHIDFGSKRLALTTAQGMVASQDTTYLYTLCLNHTLRVWQLATGKLVENRDLLDVAREPNERLQLSPAEPGLIRLVTFPKRHSQTLITYTPHDSGQFKFWDVRGGLTGDLEIKDRFPDLRLSPPDPDPSGNTVWSLTGFDIITGKKDCPAQIWLLWRNNNYHQIYTLHFDDLLDVPEAWKNSWVSVDNSKGRHVAPDMVLADSMDPSSKWLEYLFHPQRYSVKVLETALAKYQDITGSSVPEAANEGPLKERLCKTVASSVSLRKYDTSEMDYDRFSLDTDHQWRNFWRILESINESRLAPLSLTYDAVTSMVWVGMSDRCTAVRECSRIELLQNNDTDELVQSAEIIATRWPHRKVIDDVQTLESTGTVLKAISKFRGSFSPELAFEFVGAIEEQMFTESELSTPDRIVLIFNQVGLSDGLSEGAEQQLLKDLERLGGVGGLHNDLIFWILRSLSAANHKRHRSALANTAFASNLLSTAMLEDIEMTQAILLDLLALVVFIDESNDFDPPELFDNLIALLKEQERNLWLSTHYRSTQHRSKELSVLQNGNVADSAHETRLTSLMEDIFLKYVRPYPTDTRPLMYLLTELVAELQKWACGTDAVTYEDATVHVQCYLLSHGELELASDFSKFQPTTAWSCYIKGRLRLLRSEHTEAFVQFRKAAYNLACGKAIGDIKDMSASLLSLLDAEHFNSGLPRFWQHIMGLYEKQKCYSQVAEAARVALQNLPASRKEPTPGFRSEMLARLFNAELQCTRFDAAFDALIQFSDYALQRKSAVALVNAILDPQTSATNTPGVLHILQRLPWSVHPRLATFLNEHLATLAKQQTSIPLSKGQWSSNTNVDYLGVLQAYCISKNDHLGAAKVLHDRLGLIRRSGRSKSDPQATELRYALLTLINVMTCVASNEAYIVADVEKDLSSTGSKHGLPDTNGTQQTRQRKRRIITLADLRKDYQRVLDRCSRIERGDFGFDGAEETDEEEQSMALDNSMLNGTAMEL